MKFLGFDVVGTIIASGVRQPGEVEQDSKLIEKVGELEEAFLMHAL